MSMNYSSSTEPTTANRRITSVRQLELLVEFMESHKELALGRVQSKEARALASRLWSDCATICNAEGTYRNPKEWSRYWNDLKARVKTKLRSISRSMSGTGGGPSMEIPLSPIEDRVAAILGRDVVTPLHGVQQNPFQSQDSHASADEIIESIYIVERENVNLEQQLSNVNIEPEPSTSQSHSQTFLPHEPITVLPPTPFTSIESQSTVPRPNRRPKTSRRYSSMRTEITESALDQSRSIFARIEESKLKIEEKRVEADLKKTEALMEIAKAINKVADALSIISVNMPTPHEPQHTRKKKTTFVLDSSSNEIDD